MTGTGTQADPYIPTTLTEFITAVGTAGAYVALTQDINAADDPAYSGEITSPIAYRAADVDGRQHAIIGVTVLAESFATHAQHCTVHDISFRKIAHKGTTTNKYSLQGDDYVHYRFVEFSMIRDCYASSQCFAYKIYFYDSAIDLSIVGAGTSRLTDICGLVRSTAVIHGAAFGSAAASCMSTYLERSAVIYYDSIIDSGASMRANLTAIASYIAYPQIYDATIYGASDGSVSHSLLATADGQSVTGLLPQATLDQMKDKDWLTSVGFLP